jgi:hypothetical protein
MRVIPAACWRNKSWREKAGTIAFWIALGLLGTMLTGCDKCGDWWSPMRGESQSCRDQVPRPQ